MYIKTKDKITDKTDDKIIKYGDTDFYKKLDDLDSAVSKKTSAMSIAWSMREQKKFEAKQKSEQK